MDGTVGEMSAFRSAVRAAPRRGLPDAESYEAWPNCLGPTVWGEWASALPWATLTPKGLRLARVKAPAGSPCRPTAIRIRGPPRALASRRGAVRIERSKVRIRQVLADRKHATRLEYSPDTR